MKLVWVVALIIMVPACSPSGERCEGVASPHDSIMEGSPLPSGNILIAPKDVAGILRISETFADENGFRFQARVERRGFKLRMSREQMTIYAHNLDCSHLAKVRISHKGTENATHWQLAQDYMNLLYGHSSVPQFPS